MGITIVNEIRNNADFYEKLLKINKCLISII